MWPCVLHGLCICLSERHHCSMVQPHQVIETQQQEDGDLIRARKLPNPVLASHQCRALHQELLFCHRRWENAELCRECVWSGHMGSSYILINVQINLISVKGLLLYQWLPRLEAADFEHFPCLLVSALRGPILVISDFNVFCFSMWHLWSREVYTAISKAVINPRISIFIWPLPQSQTPPVLLTGAVTWDKRHA